MIRSPVYRPVYKPVMRAFGLEGVIGGLPRDGLLSYIRADTMTDSIGVSVEDYDFVGVTWQPVFFIDSTTPIIFDSFDALWMAVSAVPEFNTGNVIGSEAKGVAVYEYDTTRYILNKALRFFDQTELDATAYELYTDATYYTDMGYYV